MISVRRDIDHYNTPQVSYTSDAVAEFFSMTFKMPLEELAVKLEAFLLSGITGKS